MTENQSGDLVLFHITAGGVRGGSNAAGCRPEGSSSSPLPGRSSWGNGGSRSTRQWAGDRLTVHLCDVALALTPPVAPCGRESLTGARAYAPGMILRAAARAAPRVLRGASAGR